MAAIIVHDLSSSCVTSGSVFSERASAEENPGLRDFMLASQSSKILRDNRYRIGKKNGEFPTSRSYLDRSSDLERVYSLCLLFFFFKYDIRSKRELIEFYSTDSPDDHGVTPGGLPAK